MTDDQTSSETGGTERDSGRDYDVVLLVEHTLTAADARLVRSLHEALEDPVTYHLLLPLDDAAERIQASLGTLQGSESLSGTPGSPVLREDLGEVRDQSVTDGRTELTATVAVLEEAGATVATSEVVDGSPIEALAEKIKAVDGREAVVLTEPHTVAEFFHVDWASQARRKLGIPVLHLLEHENLDEQAGGGGQGVSGF